MTQPYSNYIAGEWVAGSSVTRDINPSDLSDVVGEYAQADAKQTDQAIAAARAAAPGLGRVQHAGARRHARQDRQRDPRAQGRAGQAAVARGGQDPARGHRRSGARGQHLQVLRRRSAAPHRRAGALRASRRRRRDHARAGRRGGHHLAVEFPVRHPGVEGGAGAGLRQLRGVQAGRPGARARPGPSPTSSRARVFRPARSTW